MVMTIDIDPADWLELGLQFVGFDKSRQKCHKTNRERFVTHFGASPETHSLIFHDLQITDISEARISKPDPLSLLIATHWLKTYPKEAQIAGTFKVDEKTVRKRVWTYVQAIAALKGMKVRECADLMLPVLAFNHYVPLTPAILDFVDRV
jgi:hypothetical protein